MSQILRTAISHGTQARSGLETSTWTWKQHSTDTKTAGPVLKTDPAGNLIQFNGYPAD